MAIAVSIVEDDAQARKILAGWISRAAGELAGRIERDGLGSVPPGDLRLRLRAAAG